MERAKIVFNDDFWQNQNEHIMRRIKLRLPWSWWKRTQILSDGQTSEEDNKLTVDKLAGEWKGRECIRWGGNHPSDECKFVDAMCFSCKKKGHIARKCRSESNQSWPRKPSRAQNQEKGNDNRRKVQRNQSANLLQQKESGIN